MSDNPYPYPGPDVTQAARLMTPCALTLVIAFALYVMRMWTRSNPVNILGWDDYTVSGAMVRQIPLKDNPNIHLIPLALQALAIVSITMSALGCQYGIGRHSYYVTPDEATKALHYSFVGQPMCVWSICLAKVSVACLLLRIKRTNAWRWFLYTAIVIQFASALAANIAELVQCKPMAALWDATIAAAPTTHCWTPLAIQISAYINVAISIITDLIFSLLPITFLYNMNRPIRERVVLGLLMGLGLLATLASIMKTTVLASYRNTRDPFWDVVPLSLWWQLEQNISIIASCIPCLKSPFERTLLRFGLMVPSTNASRTGYVQYGEGTSHHLGTMQTTIRAEKAKSLGMQGIEGERSEDSILRLERDPVEVMMDLPSKTPQITKTTQVVYSTRAVDQEMGDAEDWKERSEQRTWR